MAKSRNLHFGLEITKIDAEQRIVEGWASTDEKDRQGDRIPYDVMVDTMTGDAETLGIREMHQPKAVGMLKNWWGDKDAKRVGVQVYLSKSRDGEDALTKVKEGVLKGFSIGGRALDWAYEGSTRIIKKMALTEISLVDVPANPQAVITLVKVDKSMRKDGGSRQVINNFYFGEELKSEAIAEEEEEEELSFAEFMKPEGDTSVEDVPDNMESTESNIPEVKLVEVTAGAGIDQETLGRFAQAVEDLKVIKEVVAKGNVNEDVERLTQLGKTIGIIRRPDSPTGATEGLSSDYKKYGDPANWRYACDNKMRAYESVKLYNVGKGIATYTPREWAVLGRRIARISADTTGEMFKYDPTKKRVERENVMSDMTKASVAGLLSDVKATVNGAIEAIGSDPEKARDMLVQAMSALEVGADAATPVDTETAKPTGADTSTGVDTIKAAMSTETKPLETKPSETKPSETATGTAETASTATKPTSTMTATKVDSTATETGSSPSVSGNDSSSRLDAIESAIGQIMALLNGNVAKNAPAGDVPQKSAVQLDPVGELLRAGDLKGAIAKAGDMPALYMRVDELAKQSLYEAGVNSQKFFALAPKS
jgi:hypothetical protein